MIRSIRIALLLVLVLALSGLILGATVSPSGHAAKSPYLSALSDLSVKSAYAIPCNYICFKDAPHHYICIQDQEFNNFACILAPDQRSCVNNTELCNP